jgi:hypothetical protein
VGFIEPKESDWLRTMSRFLILGEPNSRKTSSLVTFPHDAEGDGKDGYLMILSYPGEMGANSLPRGPGIKTFVWQASPEEKLSSSTVVAQVRQLTVDILSGKHGRCKTFVGDGLHKLAEYHLDAASSGEYFTSQDFTVGEKYGKRGPHEKAYAEFMQYLQLVYDSPVPFAGFTCWERSRPDTYAGAKVTRTYPGLIGQLSEKALGMFSLVLYAYVKQSVIPTRPSVGMWQLKENKEIAGAGLKVPLEILKRLPNEIEQDWGKLYALLLGEKAA